MYGRNPRVVCSPPMFLKCVITKFLALFSWVFSFGCGCIQLCRTDLRVIRSPLFLVRRENLLSWPSPLLSLTLLTLLILFPPVWWTTHLLVELFSLVVGFCWTREGLHPLGLVLVVGFWHLFFNVGRSILDSQGFPCRNSIDSIWI